MKIPNSPVFRGVTTDDWIAMEKEVPMRRQKVTKGTVIFRQGEVIREIGLVLSGSVYIESVDLWGNRSILTHIKPGQVFAETYALTGSPLLVGAIAAEEGEILRIDLGILLHFRYSRCAWQAAVLRNLLAIFAQKNHILSGRIFCTSVKSIRGRVVTYLSAQAMEQGSCSFSIPFDRQQLADYLGVDRSALSKELGRMRDEGLLEFRKNHFILHRLSEERNS